MRNPRPLAPVPLCAGLFFLTLSTASWAAPPPKLELAFAGPVVRLSGVAPGGDAVLFGVARTFIGYTRQEAHFSQQLTDEDRDGAVELDAGAEVAPESVWVGIDLASGEVVAKSPGAEVPIQRVPPGALVADEHAKISRFRLHAEAADALLLRVGTGAWRRLVRDGDSNDKNTNPEPIVELDVLDLQALREHGPKAPDTLEQGDLLLILDTGRLALYSTRIVGNGGNQ